MNRHIDEVEFTVFDTETTGLNPLGGDRVIELAAVRVVGEKRIGSFQSLINPHRAVSQAAFAVNKISNDMLLGAPDSSLVLPRFLDFSRGSCLCSYNAPFDVGFMNNELKLLGQGVWEDTVVDVLKMARRLLPGLERHALWFVAQALGIRAAQEHRALSDVELTIGVFTCLKEKLIRKGFSHFSHFITLFGVGGELSASLLNRKISEIQQAIELGVKLQIKYLASSNAQVSEREVIPKEIKQEEQGVYLVGHCCLRNEERTFRIDNIIDLKMLA